jgi:hypothetical protein
VRRPPQRVDQDGRRLASAGHAIVVCALALVVGTLLNAPGAHKRAYNQPDGWKRDVALAVTGPLASIADALYLDRPRAGVQALIGRSGTDEIDTEIGVGADAQSTGSPAARSRPAGTKKVAFSPKNPLHMWIVGDSLVIVPGYAIERVISGNRAIQTVGPVDGRVATGLTRPDVFNWFQEIHQHLVTVRLSAVILAFGANDDKAYMTGLPDDVSIGSFGDDAWTAEYRRRVGQIFDDIAENGAHAIWIGLPLTADADQTSRFEVINAAVRAEARERPKTVTFIDTSALFRGTDGGYSQYVEVSGHGLVKVRADDGVHFEPVGGDVIAREVLKVLEEKYDVTSWASKPRG